MTLARLFKFTALLREQRELINAQQAFIDNQMQELRQIRLSYLREMHAIVGAWLISTEQPEIDIRPDLVQLDRELGNQVARIEEHVL